MASDQVRLRLARPQDADFLTDILHLAVNWDDARPPLGRLEMLANPKLAHYVAGWPRKGDVGLIAEVAQPIGATWLRTLPEDDPGYGFVAADIPELTIGVTEPWRRHGVGRMLLNGIKELARASHLRAISLSVERENPARRLYVSEGFVVAAASDGADTMLLVL